MDITVSIPIYNECENILRIIDELMPVLEGLGRSFEILFVDDGSEDGSFEILKELAQRDTRIRVIRFRRNFGQTAALDAGFKEARGEIIITMDGDLQNDPADIPRLLQKMEEGNFDIVSGWRKDRKDKFITRRIPSIIANRLISKITSVLLHDYGCTLKAYKRELTRYFNLYGEMHRFIPAIGRFIGASIAELPVNHRARKFGKSKYNLSRVVRVILDLLTVKFFSGYLTQPLKIIGRIGLLFFLVAFGALGWVVFDKVVNNQDMTNSPFFFLSILGFFSGLQLMVFGLIAEILVRTYYESQNKPTYNIKERIN
ncbi:MAG TPA: glycosyltransferase family 2 protein [Acidobacteriota bacterium]|nr:glycosyltransferase family 2 protein [Acidobacteriota bacterium]